MKKERLLTGADMDGGMLKKLVDGVRLVRYERVDLLRALLYAYVFAPLSRLLPRWALKFLAHVMAVPLLLLDSLGRTARRDYRRIFKRKSPYLLYLRQQANRLYEHSWQYRVVAHLEKPDDYRFELEGNENVIAILNGPGSVVLASGHFLRGPETFAATLPAVAKKPFYVIVAEPPSAPRTFHEWRVQLQLSVAIRALKAIRQMVPSAPPGWMNVVYRGGAFLRVLSELRHGGSALLINVDAHWEKGRGNAVSLPFAGFACRTFSTGAARAARMAGCPLVLTIPMPVKNKKVVLKCFGPYVSTLENEVDRDADVTRQVLSDLEKMVGERPEDYVLEIGRERAWCAETRMWTSKN